jgi:hypothetical protein
VELTGAVFCAAQAQGYSNQHIMQYHAQLQQQQQQLRMQQMQVCGSVRYAAALYM